MQGVAVGIDVAKDFHWVQAVDRRDSELLFSFGVENTPSAIAALVERLEGLRDRGRLTVGIDVVGGIASLLTAMLLEAGVEVVHVSGLAVNRARQGVSGGEHKSGSARRRGDRRPGPSSPRSTSDRARERAGCRDPAACRPSSRAGDRSNAADQQAA
jgi:hypothetical protein